MAINTDIILTDKICTLDDAVGLYGNSDLKTMDEFITYKNNLLSQNTITDDSEDSLYSKLSLTQPFVFNPPAFLDKLPNELIPKDYKKQMLVDYITKSNTGIKNIFNWLINSVAFINKSLYDVDDSYTISADLTEAYLTSESESGDSSDDSEDSSSTTTIYHALLKYNDSYILYNNDGNVFIYTDKEYESTDTPEPNKTLTDDEMLDIITDSLVIKFHYLKMSKIIYNDNSSFTILTEPYYYGGYGVRASFNFNKTLNDNRNAYIGTSKEITNVEFGYYYYCYLHLCGVYFYKVFVRDDTYEFLDIPDNFNPYINTDFYTTMLPDDLSTIDRSEDIEINFEKNSL